MFNNFERSEDELDSLTYGHDGIEDRGNPLDPEAPAAELLPDMLGDATRLQNFTEYDSLPDFTAEDIDKLDFSSCLIRTTILRRWWARR